MSMFSPKHWFGAALLVPATVLTLSTDALAVTLRVTVENLAPDSGTILTPTWVGFHDGTFDLYNRNESLDLFPGMEALVEDGNNAPLSAEFASQMPDGVDGTLFGPGMTPIFPGITVTETFEVDTSNQYFSYASMVIPSNDAFIANGDPLAFQIFDDLGNFIATEFIVTGDQVLDGGTEVNDEIPENTAALAQAGPNIGVDENGVVTEHPGFIPDGNVLAAIPNGDFTQSGFQVARIRIEQVDAPDAADVPEPATVLGLLTVGGGLLTAGRRRQMEA
ncbi:MAG: spondin domain-containing protein [Cyanobacteria bacterium J06632_22]